MTSQPQKKRFSLFGNSKQTKIPPPSNPSLPTPTSSASMPSRSVISKNSSRNNSSTTINTISSQPPELKISKKNQDVTRQDIHESIAYFKRIIMAAEAYRERSIKLSKDAKALAKAFRDYKDMKGVEKAFVVCLEATASFYDAFADVQGKLGDKIQKDFDNLHELFVKHNKRVARDEKVHDELIHDLEKQLKKTGNMYDKRFKKEDYPLTNHERYVNQLSELSTQIATTRADEITMIRMRERITQAQVSAIIARFAEHQFNASNDVQSKCETKRDDVRRLALIAEEKAKENVETKEIYIATEEDETQMENAEKQPYGLAYTDSLSSAGANTKDTNNNTSINSSSNQVDNSSSIIAMSMPEPQVQPIQIPVAKISMPEPDLQFTRQQDVLSVLYGDTYNQQTPTSEHSNPIVPGSFPDGTDTQREEGSVLRRPVKSQRELSRAQDSPSERPFLLNTDLHNRTNSNASRGLPPQQQFQDRTDLDSPYDRDTNIGYFRNNSPARMTFHDEEPLTPQSTRPSYMMRSDYGADLGNPYDVYQVRSTLSRSQQLPRSLSPAVVRYKDEEEESLASPYSDSGYSTSRSADIPSCQHHYHFRLVSPSSPYATPPPSATTRFSGPARCDECGAWYDRPLNATSSTLQRKPVHRDTMPRESVGRGSEYSALGSSMYRDDRPSMGSSYRRYTELPPSPDRNVKDLARRYSEENTYPQNVSPPPLPPSSESNRRVPRRLSDSAIQRFESTETDYRPNRIIDRMELKAAGITAAEDEQRRLERERRTAKINANTNDGNTTPTPAPASGSASTRKPVDLSKYNNLLVKPQSRTKTQAGVRSAPVSPQSASVPPESQRGRELPRPPGPSKFTKRQPTDYGSSISVGGGEKGNGR